jgi:hypothetical protein
MMDDSMTLRNNIAIVIPVFILIRVVVVRLKLRWLKGGAGAEQKVKAALALGRVWAEGRETVPWTDSQARLRGRDPTESKESKLRNVIKAKWALRKGRLRRGLLCPELTSPGPRVVPPGNDCLQARALD